mmetsp:Transcript_131784/g.328642  ORF Transcript_131784/g.328642 Transcript_131784/m.328642 type:complete len:978 (-) Transcript_131784:276-3209(-)
MEAEHAVWSDVARAAAPVQQDKSRGVVSAASASAGVLLGRLRLAGKPLSNDVNAGEGMDGGSGQEAAADLDLAPRTAILHGTDAWNSAGAPCVEDMQQNTGAEDNQQREIEPRLDPLPRQYLKSWRPVLQTQSSLMSVSTRCSLSGALPLDGETPLEEPRSPLGSCRSLAAAPTPSPDARATLAEDTGCEANVAASPADATTQSASLAPQVSQDPQMIKSRSCLFWSSGRTESPRKVAIKKRFRAQRHLMEALQEGAGEAVILYALQQAAAAGCGEDVLQQGRARLPESACSIETSSECRRPTLPEAVLSNRQRAVRSAPMLPIETKASVLTGATANPMRDANADVSSVGVHSSSAPQGVQVTHAPEVEVAAAGAAPEVLDAKEIQAATGAARQMKALVARRRNLRLELSRTLRMLNLAAAEHTKAANFAAKSMTKAAKDAAPQVAKTMEFDSVVVAARLVCNRSEEVHALIKDGIQLGVREPELRRYRLAADSEMRRVNAWRTLQQVLAEVRTSDIRRLELEPLMEARRRLSKAVNEALEAGLPEEQLEAAILERLRLHNTVEDRRGAVRVYCRIRPMVAAELDAGEVEVVRRCSALTVCVDGAESANSLSGSPKADSLCGTPSSWGAAASFQEFGGGCHSARFVGCSDCQSSWAKATEPGGAEDRTLSFDTVWAPGSQEDVFDSMKDLVQSAVDGSNVTVFAYGQTGAGKTFTMYGPPPEKPRPKGGIAKGPAGASTLQAASGICPRATDEVFRIIGRNKARFEFRVSLSMVELYRQHFIDLLQPKSKKSFKIRNLPSGEVVLENLSETVVQRPEDVQRLMRSGVLHRHSRNTTMNSGSSRSHVLFILKVQSMSRSTGERRVGKLLLVDLAGSERVKRSEVMGEGLREAIEINKSLSALGDVVGAIARGEKHVPYRNHELTQLLQDSLGGTAKTLMFVNLSPSLCNREESTMSLQFAQRVKGVINRPARVASASK